MAELGWIDYTLPSRGVLYGDKVPGGVVSLRPMTAKEQALLSTQGGGVIGKITAVIETCCKLPVGLPHNDLLITDRAAILLALRTKTFGSEYTFQWRCQQCGKVSHTKIDIVQELEEKIAPHDLREPVEIKLPTLGKTIGVRFRRGTDEALLLKQAKRAQAKADEPDANASADSNPIHVLAHQLVTCEGEPFVDIIARRRFIEGWSAADLVFVEQTLADLEPGIDMSLYLDCPKCEFVNELVMPFTNEFFRPRLTRG